MIDGNPLYRPQAIENALRYAFAHVPFYQAMRRETRAPLDSFATYEAFRTIPIVDKKVVQDRWGDFLSDEYNLHQLSAYDSWDTADDQSQERAKLLTYFTSGSTGSPLRIVKTQQETVIAERYLVNARRAAGLAVPTRWAFVGGGMFFLSRPKQDGALPISEVLDNGNGLVLSGISLTHETLTAYARLLEEFNPTWIYSTPSMLDFIARGVLDANARLRLPDLRLIECSGEMLGDAARARIAQAFGRRVYNHYGCQEIWGIAFECEHGSMHVFDKHVFLEVLDEHDRPVPASELGQVVITSLNLRSMPFIRYRLGDLLRLAPEPCPCGNSAPIVSLNIGRVSEYIAGHAGKVGSFVFDNVFKYVQKQHALALAQYRVLQKAPDRFEVQMVCHHGWNEDARRLFEEKSGDILGPGNTFVFRQVEAIAPNASGKSPSFVVDTQRASAG